MTRVCWARHGENVANLTRTFSHRVFDGDLTDRGRIQAAKLADALAGRACRPTVFACSPLRRARQTAEIVSSRLGQPITIELDELRELAVGDLDGRNDARAWQIYDETIAAWQTGDLDQRFPGGEDGHELVSRIGKALRAVSIRAEYESALIIAHGANIRAAVPSLTGLPDPGVDLATGALAEFSVGPNSGDPIRLLSWPTASRP